MDVSERWSVSPLKLKTVETGGGGDCMFSSLAYAIEKWSGKKVYMQYIREELAQCINLGNVLSFVKVICEDHAEYTPSGAIDWNTISFPLEPPALLIMVRDMVLKPGESFQGTDIVLRYILQYSRYLQQLSVGIIAFNSFGPGFTEIYPRPSVLCRETYLCLYCHGNSHWKVALVAVCDMKCVLTQEEMQKTLSILRHSS